MADHVVPATPTAWEIKEMMIEWFMENNLESMMLTDLTDIDLSKVAAFHHNEVERIKSGTPFYAGPNLHTALEDNVLSCRRQEFLENNLPAFSIREDTEDSVRDLLDLDLQKFGYTTYIGKTTNWAAKVNKNALLLKAVLTNGTKAVVLATHRRKSHLGIPLHFERFQDDRRGEYDFEVLVVSLHNGHPNDRQTTKLFFKYATPYNEFNEALRVATQRSVIPPIDISELDRSFQDRIADAQPNALGIAMPSPSSDSPAGNSGTSHLPYEKKQAVRGYTIADGPWLYRIALGLKIISGREVRGVKIWNREILDAEAYFEMIRFVKKMTTGKAAGEKLTVLVKHVSISTHCCPRGILTESVNGRKGLQAMEATLGGGSGRGRALRAGIEHPGCVAQRSLRFRRALRGS